MKQDGAFYWYLPDHLGTVRQVIDNSGSVVATTSLDEFGRELSSSGSADRRLHTYTGSLGVRQEDGLYLAGQRWFDPGLGRWLNPDPIGFAGGLNLFAGMGNSPVSRVDPDGLDPLGTGRLESVTVGKGSRQFTVSHIVGGDRSTDASWIGNLVKRRAELTGKGALPKSGLVDQKFNCFGETFSDDLGAKLWLEQFSDLLDKRYQKLQAGDEVQADDVLLFFQGNEPFHSMRIAEVRDRQNYYLSKDVEGGVYYGTANQVAEVYLKNPTLRRTWWRRK
jgi:RHS repeat-associated protein